MGFCIRCCAGLFVYGGLECWLGERGRWGISLVEILDPDESGLDQKLSDWWC